MNTNETDVGVVFSTQRFTELAPETGKESHVGRSNTFRASQGSYVGGIVHNAIKEGFDPNGTMDQLRDFLTDNKEKLGVTDEISKYINNQYYTTHPETGFVVSHRVAPRDFKGIIFRPVNKIIVNAGAGGDEWASETAEVIMETDPEVLNTKFRLLIEQMLESYAGKPELLLPVYDVKGNLLWPKQMSRREVNKFVEERAKKG